MPSPLLFRLLQIPEGVWPPDHYSILGLTPGQGSAAQIEEEVLRRMELLRLQQLKYPEVATEGMNQLAKAMICLTDPTARARYDQSLGLVPPLIPHLPEEIRLRPEPDPEPSVEVVPEPEPVLSLPPLILPEVPSPPLILLPLEPSPENSFRPQVLPPPEIPSSSTQTRPRRRGRYEEIVRVRQVLRIWETLRAYLNSAEIPARRRVTLATAADALKELKQLLPEVHDLIGSPGQPGAMLAAFARQNSSADMLRNLLPSQRSTLLQDCMGAHYRLSERAKAIRADLRSRNQKGFARLVVLPSLRATNQHPEYFCLIVGFLAMLIALIRSMP